MIDLRQTVSPNALAAHNSAVDAHIGALQSLTSAINFSAHRRGTITLSANTNWTGANYTAGTTVLVHITASGGPWTHTFPSGWRWNTPKPTQIAAGKVACMILDCLDATEAGVRVSYGEES